MSKKLIGATLATAAALAFVATPVTAAHQGMGGNSTPGNGSFNVAYNNCHNHCHYHHYRHHHHGHHHHHHNYHNQNKGY